MLESFDALINQKKKEKHIVSNGLLLSISSYYISQNECTEL